ncbi:Uncharacterised protein [Salmonella enterica subsp. enterica serovar Bovismorbificans]|nr:Uncharacterised protein [Salmonella enterica subsp. enterica serovar Bovismorbificans]
MLALLLSGLVRVVKITSTLAFSAGALDGCAISGVLTPGPFAWVTTTVATPSALVVP